MRIHVRHEIAQVFDPPVRFLNEVLRLTPRSHESQHVARWRVEIDGDSRIRASDDAFGNCMHTLSVTEHTGAMRIVAEGIVDTFDAAGIVRATVERFPPELFLRETALTAPDDRLRDLSASAAASNPIENLHTLLLRMGKGSDGGEDSQSQEQTSGPAAHTSAEKARAIQLTHDFIVCARILDVPARFVSGYFIDPGKEKGGAHCWAEAYVDGVGWIGFDPVHEICPHESHVRMAVGLDALDAICVRAAPAPVSATESVDVRQHG